ncbi:MAG: C25 family cysteine peptidase, partial [candidate division Zixibacteria bacterium]
MRSLLELIIKISAKFILIAIFVHPAMAGDIFDTDVDILESDITGVTIRYRVPDHEITPDNIAGKQYHSIQIPRTAQIRKDGQVEIPVKIVPLAVPPMARISIQVLGEEYYDVPFRKLAPFFARPTLEEFNEAFSSELARNPKLPSSRPYILSEDEVRGLNIIRLAIPTARYSEISSEMSILNDITVRVDFIGGRENLAVGYRNPGAAFERILRSVVVNYDAGREWFLPRIASPASLMATSTAFDSSDTWVRIELLSEGIYKFGWLEFNAAGIDPLSVDPSQVRMFYGGGRELPLSNLDSRPALLEIPVEILGGDDGQFDNGDYVIFYADAADSWEYSEDLGLFQHYRNHYTNRNVYWLTLGGSFSNPPLRFAVSDGAPDGLYDVSVDGFTAKYHKEEEWIFWRQLPNSGIYNYFDWYWGFGRDFSATVQLFDIVPGEEAQIVIRHKSGTPYLTVNGSGSIAPSTNQDFSTYSTVFLSNGPNSFILESSSDFYLDYIDVHYERWLKLIDGNLLFAQPDTFGTIRYNLAEVSSPYILLDISDKSNPVKIMGGDLEGQDLVFHDTASAGSHKQYYISTVPRLKSPGSVSLYELDNLRDISSSENRADEIIITHDSFYDQAVTLAELREQEYDMPTRIVRISDVYNQFSFGLVDAVAVRDFLKYAYENWPEPAPTFALLLGDGHYDFRNNLGSNNPVFIPPFENDRQMTDDHFIYFGESGHLDSDSSGAPDMMIGRIPANSVQDADDMIGKIVDYDANPDLGTWR